MFVDHDGWPPAPDGAEPARPQGLSKRDERILLTLIGLLLVAIMASPLAGSSVIAAIAALF